MESRPEKLSRPSVPALDEILGKAFPVLDDGLVRVVDYMGDDAAIVMNKAIPFIREQAKAKKPFLAVVWFHNVHTPLGKKPELMK